MRTLEKHEQLSAVSARQGQPGTLLFRLSMDMKVHDPCPGAILGAGALWIGVLQRNGNRAGSCKRTPEEIFDNEESPTIMSTLTLCCDHAPVTGAVGTL